VLGKEKASKNSHRFSMNSPDVPDFSEIVLLTHQEQNIFLQAA